METKQCRQCGEIKPVAQFRQYYNGSGTYTICKTCEKINSRAKYLRRKGDKATPADKSELDKIEQLYELQRACGLKPPKRNVSLQSSLGNLDELLGSYKDRADKASDVPAELQEWLTAELTDVPEYYLETIYEQLVAKYRPVLKIDQSTLLPVYDNTYVSTLNKILDRFTAYEDKYYE